MRGRGIKPFCLTTVLKVEALQLTRELELKYIERM